MTKVQQALTGLVEACAKPLDRNDLGRLARMHTWCQDLVEKSATDGSAVPGGVAALATALTTLLERLILAEAADPELGIALVPEVVQAIKQASEGQSVATETVLARVAAAAGTTAAPAVTTPTVAAEPAQTSAAAAPPAPAPKAPAADVQCVPAAPTASPAASTVAAPPSTAAPTRTGVSTAAPGVEPYVSEPLMLDLGEREHLEGFLDEAVEHMDAIETGLLQLEADPSDTQRINELFRPFHTIKGIAGFLNLRDINRLTHEIETILDLGRRSELKITATTVDLIFAAVDALKTQLASIRQYLAAPTGGPCPQPDITSIMARLRQAAKPGGGAEDATAAQRPKLGELLVAEGVATPADVQSALASQETQQPRRKLGEVLVAQGVVQPAQVENALAQQAGNQPVVDYSIRVDTRKLDMLVDAVGELVIAQSMVALTQAALNDEKLQRNISQVTKIVRDVQETAMAMRMVPIGQTFQKMRRVVRDVARKANKQVELVITGEDTELDKNVIQQMSDPLVHMVRNAIDHGIEPPEERRAAGKPETGKIILNAYHQGDSIVIEVRDDGRGLIREKLIAKGIERGLISPDDQLSDQQVYALILQSGFSTAEKVTDISGRGVGMDVVRRNVEQLRGKIEIHSEPGRGSAFLIRLPLTLAIIDGMLVRVGAERFIIPTILIEQSLRPERRQITSVQRRGAMLQVRGELCPLIQLGALFGCCQPIDPCEHLVVIVQCEGQKIALVVHELIGQQQVVIKALDERFKCVRGISGAAILGDGRVGLIIEPSGLLTLHNERRSSIYQATSGVAVATRALPAAGLVPQSKAAPGVLPVGGDVPGVNSTAEPVSVPVPA